MVERVRLDADGTSLINTINRGTEAWNRFNQAQLRVVKESAKLTRAGVIVTRRVQAMDTQGRKVTATFRGVAGAMQLVGTSVTKTASAMDAAKGSASGLSTSLQSIRRAIGFSLLFRSVTALQQALTKSTEEAIEFSRRIAEIQTIQGKVSLSTNQWSTNLRALSDSFGIDILTQAEAAYQTLSNQVAQGRDTFIFLESANKLALTAVTDTASAVNLLTSAINAFGLDISQSDQISAQFFKTVELGRVRISELADIFGRVGVPAAQLGIGMDEIQASIAAITVQGVRSEEALTLIRNVILKLIRPTDDMKRIFQELGIASAEAGIAAFGFGGFLGKIEKAAGGTTTGLGKAFGRVRALTGALVFASESGAKAFENALEELNKPDLLQSFEKNFKTVFDSNGEVIRRETNRIRNFFQVELGQKVLESIASFTKNFGGMVPILEAFGTVIKVVAAPAAALLTFRLLAVVKGAKGARVAMIAFAKANPFTLLVAGGLTLIGIFDALSDTSEKSAERIRKANEALSKTLADNAAENRKAIIKEAELATKALQLGTRAFVAPLVDSVGALNKEFNDLNKDAKNFNKEIDRAAKATLKAADQTVKKTRDFLKELEKTAKDAKEAIQDATESTGDDVFELKIDAAGADRAISLIGTRIRALEQVRADAVRQGDLKGFNDTQKEIRKLAIQRNDLRFSAERQVSAEERLALGIRLRNKLLEDELRLRKRITETIESQEVAANKVRVEQELLRKDLAAALKTFRGEGLTQALAGDDEGQIRRTLSERQNAAARLGALQERLGVSQVSSGEIAIAQQRDLENAANRINKIRLNGVVKERQELDKQIEARLKAQATENTERSKSLNEEIDKLARLRTVLGSSVKLEGFNQSNITGGSDTTALSQVLGGQGVRLSEDAITAALQPTVSKINQLIGILQRDPSQVSPRQRDEAANLRLEIINALARITPTGNRARSRTQLESDLQSRLGRPTGGVTPLIGSGTRVTQEEINKDIKSVLSVFDAIAQGTERLTKGTAELIEERRKLQQSTADAVADSKAVAKAEKDRLNALKIGTDGQKEQTKAQESLTDLVRRRNALEGTGQATASQLRLGADQQVVTDATKKATTAAAPQLAENYKNAVVGARAEVKKSQIEATLAAERERNRIAAAAAAGPNAAKKAAEAISRSPFQRRKIQAEKRAAERKASTDAARRKQNERIASAKAARESEARVVGASGDLSSGERAAQAALGGFGPDNDIAEELKFAIQRGLNDSFSAGDARSTAGLTADPLGLPGGQPGLVRQRVDPSLGIGIDVPIGLQPVDRAADGALRLSTELNTAASQLDIFNETLQGVSDRFLGVQDSDVFIPGTQIPVVPIGQRRVGDTDLAVSGAQFEDGQTTIQLQSISEERKKAATALANFVLSLENAARRAQNAQFEQDFFFNSGGQFGNPVGPLGFAEGGGVPGTGSRDSVSAMLTPGEFVVNKQSTRRFLPDLIRMNNARPRRFQDGGAVGDINFGGFNVTESQSAPATAKAIERLINRGIRQGTIKIRS